MSRPKVAIVTSGFLPIPPTKGGAVETLVEYIVEENERKHGLDLVVYSSYEAEAERASESFSATEVRFVRTPFPVEVADRAIYFLAKNILHKEKHLSYRYILQRLFFIRQVGRDLALERFDRVVFENHPTLLGALKFSDNASKYANKSIYHLHNEFAGLFGCEKEMAGCRRVVGVSHFILEHCFRYFESFPGPERWAVLKNRADFRGLSASEESVLSLRHRFSIPEGAKVVLFAGRLCREKGALELVEAFSRLQMTDSVLLILGAYYFGSEMRSSYESRLRSKAEALSNRVVFTGYVDHREMGAFYALADVVVVPSIEVDAAPLSVIEPLTVGRPVVTTRVGGIPEYATDGVDSVVLDVDDRLVDNIADAIDGVLQGRIQLQRCSSYDLSLTAYYDEFIKLVTE